MLDLADSDVLIVIVNRKIKENFVLRRKQRYENNSSTRYYHLKIKM